VSSAERLRRELSRAEVPLQTYAQLQAPRDADQGLFRRILRGLSCGQDVETAEAVPEAFGLSPSTVSRRFIRASARQLQALQERRLDASTFVALVLDGKTFAEDTLVAALGITAQGQQICLGFVPTGTENATTCGAFLRQLVERGLRYDAGLLGLIDGSQRLRQAVAQVFGAAGLVQRCQWHKRANVRQSLPKAQQVTCRRKLPAAYAQPTSAGAQAALARVRKDLQLLNQSAVESLAEGLEETLTLHRLGGAARLGPSLSPTNCLESIFAQVEQRTAKVDCGRTSDQKHRWMAAALLDIEPRLRRIKGYQHLPLLQRALHEEVTRMTGASAAQVAA
jgi:transposase-like protein